MENSNLPALPSANQIPLDAIDLLKFVFSICIISTHAVPLSGISELVTLLSSQSVTRMSNSFFFICAGYFYARRATRKGWTFETMWGFIRRLLILYGAWTVLYIPFIILESDDGWMFCVKFIYKFIFTGSFFHFWYFPSLISSVVLYHYLQKRFNFLSIFCLGLLLYLFCLAGNSYWKVGRLPVLKDVIDVWNSLFLTTRNLMMSGFIYVALGAQAFRTPLNLGFRTVSILAFTCAIFMIGESYLLKTYQIAKNYNCFLFMVPAAFFLFEAGLKSSIKLKFDSVLIRNLSIVNYCLHPMLIRIGRLSNFLNYHKTILFLCVVACSLVIGFLIIKSKNKYIRYLY